MTTASSDRAYQQLSRVVRGAVTDTFNYHPDYLTPKGLRSAPGSLIKRITGTVLGFAVQAAESQRKLATPEDRAAPPDLQVPPGSTDGTGAGARFRQPHSYPRFHRVVRLNPRMVRAAHMGRDRQKQLITFIEKSAQLARELGRPVPKFAAAVQRGAVR